MNPYPNHNLTVTLTLKPHFELQQCIVAFNLLALTELSKQVHTHTQKNENPVTLSSSSEQNLK